MIVVKYYSIFMHDKLLPWREKEMVVSLTKGCTIAFKKVPRAQFLVAMDTYKMFRMECFTCNWIVQYSVKMACIVKRHKMDKI